MKIRAGHTLAYAELLPMRRACYELSFLLKKFPSQAFLGENCSLELLSSIHVHIDNLWKLYNRFLRGVLLGRYNRTS